MERINEMEETIKKSGLLAKTSFDFNKLQEAGSHFLDFTWEDKGEEMLFRYDQEGLVPLVGIRNEEFPDILNVLIRIGDFAGDVCEYHFELAPANLFYNTSGLVRAKLRDLQDPYKKNTQEDFLKSYKALAACVLTGQYSFKDFLEGGEDLLKKSTLSAPLFEKETAEDVQDYLEQTKENYILNKKKKSMIVNKQWNFFLKGLVLVLLVAATLLGVYCGLQYFKNIPYLTAVTTAGNAYIENDSVGVIDALNGMDVADMQKHQKYILAQAYLQSESLTAEQKGNIIDKLTLSSNVKEMEYWIYIGRLNVKEAENIAMQLSDDELLLYAYMKDREQVEMDSSLSGEEKEKQIKELQSKIDTLSEQFR